MEAADSDKDSKSSELTIGPSCIQFRLIIVKVEKFQSAISNPCHPRGIPNPSRPPPSHPVVSHSIPKRASVPFSSSASRFRIRFYEFRTIARYRTFVSLRERERERRKERKRERDFRLHCLRHKGKFSRSALAIGEQPNDGAVGHILYVAPLTIRTET